MKNTMTSNLWLVFALLSALFAALTSIFAKVGIEGVNSNLATALRTIVVLIMAWGMVFITKSQGGIDAISTKSWVFLILSGLATGASWLCYFKALQIGPVWRAERPQKGRFREFYQADIDMIGDGSLDIINEAENVQKLSESQRQIINPVMNGLARTTPKSRKEISVFGQPVNEYKNSIVTLTIGMNKNNKLLQLTKNSIPFYFACVAELVEKYKFKDIGEETYPTIVIPTRAIFELFGKDFDNDTQRYDFLKECKQNADIWRIASVSATNGKDFYSLSSLLTEYTITKDYFSFGFTNL